MCIYILNIYIRNNNHRDYQSRADSVTYKQERIKEEEKEKVGHSETMEMNRKIYNTNTFPLKITTEVYNDQEDVYFVVDILV